MTGVATTAVREARRADLPALVGLLHEDVIREVDEAGTDPERYAAAFDEIAADAHQQLLVLESDGEVVGTAQVSWLRRLTYVGGLVCVVESVRVRSDRRGRGLGGVLMGHVVTEARRRGAARVELTTNSRRERAQEFYRRLGFVASHVGMKLYLGAGAVDGGSR